MNDLKTPGTQTARGPGLRGVLLRAIGFADTNIADDERRSPTEVQSSTRSPGPAVVQAAPGFDEITSNHLFQHPRRHTGAD